MDLRGKEICSNSSLPLSSQMFQGYYQKMVHHINPLHVYCILRKIGVSREIAKPSCRIYEKTMFKTFFNNGHGKSRVSKLLKTLDIFSPDAES